MSHHEKSAGYTSSFRWVEIASIVSFFVATGLLLQKLAPQAVAHPVLAAVAVLLGYFAADFISGVVHWLADTWGTVNTPVVGTTLVRPFREHHVDPLAITRHDFVETNGANCLVSLPVAVVALLVPASSTVLWFILMFSTSLILWIFGTNQFHKWSHTANPPRVVRWFQRLHVILPIDHHDIHHRAPFTRYYCITAGWMNEPLARIDFFPRLERLITRVSGALPRAEVLESVDALVMKVTGQLSAQSKSS